MNTLMNHNLSANNRDGAGREGDPAGLVPEPPAALPAPAVTPRRTAFLNPWGMVRAVADRITRRRNRFGDRLPSWGVWHMPHPEARAADSALPRLLARIAADRPEIADWLEHLHDLVLRAGREAERRRLEAEAEMAAWNAHVHAVDTAVDAEQAELQAAAEAAAAPHRAAAAALEPGLHAALGRAGALTARAGRSFDPAAPSEADLLRVDPRSLPELAAELRVPDPDGDRRSHLRQSVAVACTAGVGCLIGLSLGLMSGILQADALQRQVLLLVPVLALGLVAAVWMGRAIWAAHREASQRGALGRGAAERWGPLAAALGTDAAILLVELIVEREGILRGARVMQSVAALGGGPATGPPDWVWWVAPLVVSLGFVLSHAWEGHVAGRIEAVTNRLLLAQADDLGPRTEAHHGRPDVREALAAILGARELQRRHRELLDRAAAAARPFEQRSAEAEARRQAPQTDLSPEQLRRIQDAQDEVNGPNHLFHAALLSEVRRMDGWWAGLQWRSRLRGRARSRR